MSKILRKNAALVKLIYEVQNETASTSQLKKLSDLLRGDQDAQKLYVFLMDMHAELTLEQEFLDPDNLNFFSNRISEELPQKNLTGRRQNWSQYLLLTVCYFIPLVVLSYFFYSTANSFSHSKVAVIDEIEEGVLTQNSKQILKNAPLLTGYKYHLEHGVVRILMDSGAEVILESPAMFEVLHRNSIRLENGTLAAEVASDAIGFVVETPTQRVVDLGTRFGVSVSDDGSSETHVFHGKVVCAEVNEDQGESMKHLLSAGQAIQVKGDGSKSVEMKTNEGMFPRALKFQAQIEKLVGAIQYQQEMPQQLGAGDFTSSQYIYLFQEQKNLILPTDVTVWKIPPPGTTINKQGVLQTIPKGTKVNVFLLHLDGPHKDLQGQPHPAVRLNGKIHFKFPILGGLKKDADFYATDQILGRSDVAYDNQEFKRSGRSIDTGDKTALSNKDKTLAVSWSQRGSGGIGRDQIRILVATEE